MHPGYPPPPPGYGYPPGYGPAPGYGYPAGPTKSNTPRTLGTLSMVFGGIVAAISLFGLLAGKQFGQMVNTNQVGRAAFDRYMADIHSASMAMSAAMLVMSVALIYIGTGQRSYQRWAVRASVWWGVAALVYLGVQMIVQFTVILPAMDRLLDAISNSRIRGSMGAIMKVSVFSGILFYAPFPIVLISSFRKQVNVDAMDQPPLPTAEIHKG
ncbi:MAG: hypothetical protein IPL61_07090 [Myxococcales bacterium]|nr:hypothetical protein [Myxococcales bacterium]